MAYQSYGTDLAQTADYQTTAGAGVETNAVVKSGAGAVYTASALNHDATNAKIIMLFDAASLPANGTVPKLAFPIAAASSATAPAAASLQNVLGGIAFATGIVIATSTTAKTLTIDTIANCFFMVQYK